MTLALPIVENTLHTAEEWAQRIRVRREKTVEAVISLGRTLCDAKRQLPYGEWQRLFSGDLVPMSLRTAQSLMLVARHPLLSDTKNFSLLPPNSSILFELAQIDAPQLRQAIESGRVTSRTKWKDARALVRQTNAVPPPISPPPTRHLKTRAAVQARHTRMREMAAQGYSSRQIAAAMNMPPLSCRQTMHRAGIIVPADRLVGRTRLHDANRIVDTMVAQAENLCADVKLIDYETLDRSRVSAWLASLRQSARALRAFISRLTKEDQYARTTTDTQYEASLQDRAPEEAALSPGLADGVSAGAAHATAIDSREGGSDRGEL